MTRKQTYCIEEARKSLNNARKWLDQAMYYTGDGMPDNELQRIRKSYDDISKTIDTL